MSDHRETHAEILDDLVRSLKDEWDKACASDDVATWRDKAAIASALTAAIRQLHRPADVKAFLRSPEWADMRGKITAALAPYPEALTAVVAALDAPGVTR